MIQINSLETLNQCLGACRAILFIHFDWSGQSMHSLKVFEKLPEALDMKFLRIVPAFFRVDPDRLEPGDADEALDDFMSQKPSPEVAELSGGGFGSVVWLSRGKVVAYEPYAAKVGLEGLILRTQATMEDPSLLL